MKTVSVPPTGGITSLRNSDALILRQICAARRGELCNDPAVSELIIEYHWITAGPTLAGAAKARP